MLCPKMKETKNTEVDSAFFAICPVVDSGILMAHNRMKIPAHSISQFCHFRRLPGR